MKIKLSVLNYFYCLTILSLLMVFSRSALGQITPITHVSSTLGSLGGAIKPAINTQPHSQTVSAGTTATFSVKASGMAPLTYHWYRGSTAVGGNSSTLTLANVIDAKAGSYKVVVSNLAGSVTSITVTLTVIHPPVITTQPKDQTVNAGATGTFSVKASGTGMLSYQWYHGATAVGGNSSTLPLTNVTDASAGSYKVVVSKGAGSVTSRTVTLTVIDPPVISMQPQSQTINAGATATFSVVASGTAPFSYRWYHDSTVLGGNSPTLTLANVTSASTGNYTVVVSNGAGSVTSSAAVLAVTPRIMNINFASADTKKVGFGAIGLTANDFWNGYEFPWGTSVALTNLKWSDSSSSTVGIEVDNAPGQWGNPVSDGMYDSYIYSWDGNNVTITLTNLPAGTYDFYLYGHGNADDQNGIFNLVSDSVDYGTKAITTVGSDSWNSTVWQEGRQYEVMRGVAVAANQPVTINVLPANAAYGLIAVINGIQIVPAGSLSNGSSPVINLLNVNFASADTKKVGFAATGQTTNDFWNGYQFPWDTSVAVSNLKWADYTSSAVGIEVDNAPGQWGNPVSDGMFDSYIYSQNGGNITLTIANLPTGTYDFYVYGHGSVDDQNGIYNLVSGSIDYGAQATTVVGSDSWTTANWTDGQQYVLFAGVPVVSSQPVVINVLPDNSNSYGPIAMINGLQIVKVKNPAP
jgi:Immunoglobulin domain